MTEEDRLIVNFIRERDPWLNEKGWSDDRIYHAYHDTLFYARVRLSLAVDDFKSALRKVFS